jgi:DtxR family Mn-dependent transcriptional regulator
MWGMGGRRRARMRRRLGARGRSPGEVWSLGDLRPGQEGRVAYIETVDGRRLEQLSGLGIVPDAVLRLLQKRPAPVVKVGETEVAIDFDIARQIYVKPLT